MNSTIRRAALAVILSSVASLNAIAQEAPPIPRDRLLQSPSPRGLVVEPVINVSTTVLGQAIEYTKTDSPEVVSVLQVFQPGGETGWHYHVHSSHIYVVEGTLQLEMLDGKKLEFKQGQAYMESVNTWHIGRNVGTGTLKLLVVSFLEKGKSNNVFGKVN
jgi:quercetin dioxygenase-like cupin family protein